MMVYLVVKTAALAVDKCLFDNLPVRGGEYQYNHIKTLQNNSVSRSR
jgi:hypothetical protein